MAWPRSRNASSWTGRARADGSGELWAMMLDTATAFDALVRRNATDEEQAERILANTFYRNISGSLSGTQEYMAAETLHLLHDDERFDLVVVDTPPSRNALDFLEAPGVLARFLDHRLFKLLMLPARRGMRVVNVATQPLLRTIGKVVGSDVLADAVAFFQAFAGMEQGFRQRADAVIGAVALRRHPLRRRRLAASGHRDGGGVVHRAARRAGIQQVVGVANRVHPAFGPGTAAGRPQAGGGRRVGRRQSAGCAVGQRRRAAGAGRVGAGRARAVRRTARRATGRRAAALRGRARHRDIG